MNQVVAAGAEADEVVEVGFAFPGPPDRVMHLEVGVVTSRGRALTALTGDDGAALFEGREAVGAADVEDVSVAALEDRGDVGVAAEVAEEFWSDRAESGELRGRAR